MSRRFRASYKIAIGFAVLAPLAIYGYRYSNYFLLGREHFPPQSPGQVNIIGIDPNAGYGILIENQTAKLVLGSGGSFKPGEMTEKSLQDSDTSDRKFIPIKDMLKGMQGNIPSLSYFVQRLNEIKDDDLHDGAPVWKAEDIEKALNGDKALEAKLVNDLNVTLDGMPLDHFRRNALFNGILTDTPVPITVQMGAEKKKLVARVKQLFEAAFMKDILNRINGKFADNSSIAAVYGAAADEIKAGTLNKENLRKRLTGFAQDAARLAAFPQQILDSITPVINENQITGARYTSEPNPRGNTYTLHIDLTDEGRKRLYQFTRNRVHEQLLLTINGVAIAAPIIDHELASSEIEISKLQDEAIVKDAVDTINEKRVTTTK